MPPEQCATVWSKAEFPTHSGRPPQQQAEQLGGAMEARPASRSFAQRRPPPLPLARLHPPVPSVRIASS
jgi:hypothetical protein